MDRAQFTAPHAQELLTLEAARALLLVNLARVETAIAALGPPGPDELDSTSSRDLAEHVLSVLGPGAETWKASEVVNALRLDGVTLPPRAHQRVRDVLARLVNDGRAERVAVGHYRASESPR